MNIETYLLRSHFLKHVRNFFDSQDFIEVETPIVVPTPGTEVYLGYFDTSWVDHKNNRHQLFLRSSPEIHLKKALADGLSKVYEIAKCFRNEGELSSWHHPEFTMLEFYQSHISYESFMELTEHFVMEMHQFIKEKTSKTTIHQEKFHRVSVYEAFEEFANIILIDGDPELAAKAKDQNIASINKSDDFETAFFKILLDKIEPKLQSMGAVFLYDYPPSQAALAKIKDGKAKRFELYVRGIELCNAFDELTDSGLTKKRIQEALRQRQAIGKSLPNEDQAFYNALETGIPECGGNAVGLDRLLAVLLGANSLDQVIPFRRRSYFSTSFMSC